MSFLIKGMKMPKDCENCPMLDDNGDYPTCILTWTSQGYNWSPIGHRMRDCPLVEVPPHGRLIDADAFIAEQRRLYCENCERRKGMKNGKVKFVYDIGDAPCRSCGYGDVLDDLENAPTIIEAEGYSEQELQRDYEASVEYAQYCERYEPTYDPDTGAM